MGNVDLGIFGQADELHEDDKPKRPSARYYVVVEVRDVNDDMWLGRGTCSVDDLSRTSIAAAARAAGADAEGSGLARERGEE